METMLEGAAAPTRGRALRRDTHGNELLTTLTGALLIVMLAALGITILRIGQLIWLHLFIGLALLGPLVLKIASTGYRFARYYTSDADYRAKGPPPTFMRLLAPVVVASTVLVFLTGVILLAVGPANRDPWLLFHKASFIIWLGATGVHILGHLPALMSVPVGSRRERGTAVRWLAIGGALAAGLIFAAVLIPDFTTWTAHMPQHFGDH